MHLVWGQKPAWTECEVRGCGSSSRALYAWPGTWCLVGWAAALQDWVWALGPGLAFEQGIGWRWPVRGLVARCEKPAGRQCRGAGPRQASAGTSAATCGVRVRMSARGGGSRDRPERGKGGRKSPVCLLEEGEDRPALGLPCGVSSAESFQQELHVSPSPPAQCSCVFCKYCFLKIASDCKQW